MFSAMYGLFLYIIYKKIVLETVMRVNSDQNSVNAHKKPRDVLVQRNEEIKHRVSGDTRRSMGT
jgi:hypothetical protein